MLTIKNKELLDKYIAKVTPELEGEDEWTIMWEAVRQMHKECYQNHVKRVISAYCFDVNLGDNWETNTEEISVIMDNGKIYSVTVETDCQEEIKLGAEENWAIQYMMNTAVMFGCELSNELLQDFVADLEEYTHALSSRPLDIDSYLMEEVA